MATVDKGGRGKKAPYETEMYRIPSPIKATVQRISTAYKVLVGYERVGDAERMLEQVEETARQCSQGGILSAIEDEEKLISGIHEKIKQYLLEKDCLDMPDIKRYRNYTELKRFADWLNQGR